MSLVATAKEQTTVPPEVDTMREEICPVCGSDDSYVGDKCSVCGFEKPPSLFMDPDTSLAQNVNLRQQDQEDANDDGAGDLQCPECGETFSSAEALNQAGDPHLAPAAQTIPAEQDLVAPEEGSEEPEGPLEAPEDEDENQMAPGPPEDAMGVPGQPEPPEEDQEEELPPGQPEDQDEVAPGQEGPEPPEGELDGEEIPEGAEEEEEPEQAEQEQVDPEAMAEQQYAADQQGMADTGYEEGDICPNCGQGILQEVGPEGPIVPPETSSPRTAPDSGDQGQSPFPVSDEDEEDEGDQEEAPGADEAEESGGQSDIAPEDQDDGDEDQEPDDEDGDEDEDEDGIPPWVKKKTSSHELPAIGRSPSTMANRTRTNGRVTPRQPQTTTRTANTAQPEPTPRTSVRTALHASLNQQAHVLRQMTAACQQERILRLAAEARITTLERQMLRFAQLAGADHDAELRSLNEEGYRTHTALMARAASLHDTTRHIADQRDPGQPVPEPAPAPPVVTEQEAAQPAGRDDVTQLGATPVADVSADATLAVDEPYGTAAFEPLNLNQVDVTAPVQNTQGHLPPEQTIIPVEVRVGDPDDPQPSFGWTIDGGNPSGQTGGSVGSGAPTGAGRGAPGVQPGTTAARNDGQVSLGALRLARLRMQAGIAPANQDDLSIAAAIQDNPALTVEAINTEIRTLTQVLSAQPQAQQRTAAASRRLVPRAAPGAEPMPSLAPSGEGPIRSHASTGQVTADEMLFE
jgi:hypothetical protein